MTVKDESFKLNKQRNCLIEIGNSFEEDITAYVNSIDINHTLNGDTYLINEINPSTSGIMVKNYNNYFKDKQLSKLPIRIKSGYSGLNDEVFKGYLKRDSYRVGSKELSLSSESYLQVFKKSIVNKEILENFFIEDIVKRAIEECVTDGTTYDLQKTGIKIPVCNLNKFDNWSSVLIQLIPASQFVLIYEDGLFRFRKFWDSTKPSVYSFDVDNIKELVQTKSADDIKNSILLSSNYEVVSPKDKLSENLVNQTQISNETYYIQDGYNNRIKVQNVPLYKDQELVDGEYKFKTDTTVFIVDENSSRFGEKVLITDIDVDNGYIYLAENLQAGLKLSVSYKYLQLQLNPGQERTYTIELNNEGRNIQLLCAAWKNNSQFDSGERVAFSTIPNVGTLHLTDTIEQKDNKIRFTLKNNTTSIVTISTLQAYGNPIKSFSPIKAKYKNPVSVTKYGEKVLEIDNDFIVSEQQARDLGVFLYSNCSDLVEKIEIQLPQHLPFLKIGDKVTVTENSTSINYDFMITSIRHSYNENEWSTSFNAIKYPILLEDIVPEYLTKDNQGNYITSSLFNDTPLPSPSNFKVQYNNNLDGTKNISLSWADIDDIASPRDGYEIFISTKNASGSYTVDFQYDIHFEIRPESRAMILRNLPFKETIDSTDFFKYYAFAIRPFRDVHPEISPDKTGILRGDISYFNTTYKKIDDFTLYNGSTIEQSVNGVIETTSVSILNTMLNALQMNKTYDNSLRFDDFKGMRVVADTGNGAVDRFTAGQIEPGKYGVLGKNGDNEEVFRLDQVGLKTENMVAKKLQITDGTDSVLIDANTKTINFDNFDTKVGKLTAENIDVSDITASNINVTKSDNKVKININSTVGIKIQQNVSGSWVDKFSTDSNGDLALDGNLVRGSGNNIFKATANGIQLGHDTFSSAPFRVDLTGALTATNANISGTITSTSGSIGGWSITSTGLKLGTGSSTRGIDSGSIAFYAGSSTPSSAPFRVDTSGNLTATNANITGTITGSSISGTTISGGTFTTTKDDNGTTRTVTIYEGTIDTGSGGVITSKTDDKRIRIYSGFIEFDTVSGNTSTGTYGFWGFKTGVQGTLMRCSNIRLYGNWTGGSEAEEGSIFWDSTNKKLRIFDGSVWRIVSWT